MPREPSREPEIKTVKLMKRFTLILIIFLTGAVAQAQTPRTAEDYNNRGLERQSNGDLEGAIADYTKAISMKATPSTRCGAGTR